MSPKKPVAKSTRQKSRVHQVKSPSRAATPTGLIVSISGLRGVVGDTLTPETVIKYANAFARFSKNKK